MFTAYAFVEESNTIEGINREPSKAEIEEFERFVALDKLTIEELEAFVEVYEPGKKLRGKGFNVRVGDYIPPPGGSEIRVKLQELLGYIDKHQFSPYFAHVAHIDYEHLHPFEDCNGRSGRMIWAWMVGKHHALQLGFLHSFYYQTLSAARKASDSDPH